jgi:pimeloyl-ACP methyl ester carboxylesterase
MRRSRINRKVVLISALIVVTVVVLVAFLSAVIVGQTLPAAPRTPIVEGTETARFDKGTIRYQELGDGGDTVLFLHGFNGHLGQWDQVWRELEGCNCRRLRIDIPGFGDSDWHTDEFGLPEQAARVIALLDKLNVDDVTLVGTSMGGSLSAWIAARYPDRVKRLVLLAPSGFPGSLTQAGLYGRLARPGIANRAAILAAKSPLFSALYPHSRAMQALTVTATYGKRWEDELSHIRAPTLVLWSRGDETTPYRAAAPVRDAITASTLIALDEATGHLIPTERAQLTAQTIQLVIQGVTPSDIAAKLPQGLLRPGEGPAL